MARLPSPASVRGFGSGYAVLFAGLWIADGAIALAAAGVLVVLGGAPLWLWLLPGGRLDLGQGVDIHTAGQAWWLPLAVLGAWPAVAYAVSRDALQELRDLVRGIYPPVLVDRGLKEALLQAAERFPVPVDIDIDLPSRPPEAVESTAYFVVCEALTNIAKHSGASRATVYGRRAGDLLTVEIRDDGHGGADAGRGSGLVGIRLGCRCSATPPTAMAASSLTRRCLSRSSPAPGGWSSFTELSPPEPIQPLGLQLAHETPVAAGPRWSCRGGWPTRLRPMGEVPGGAGSGLTERASEAGEVGERGCGRSRARCTSERVS